MAYLLMNKIGAQCRFIREAQWEETFGVGIPYARTLGITWILKGQLWEPIMCCAETVQEDRKIRNSQFFFSLESIGNSNLPKQSKSIIVSVCRG